MPYYRRRRSMSRKRRSLSRKRRSTSRRRRSTSRRRRYPSRDEIPLEVAIEAEEQSPGFIRRHRRKIIGGAAALALVGGSGYGGYLYGKGDHDQTHYAGYLFGKGDHDRTYEAGYKWGKGYRNRALKELGRRSAVRKIQKAYRKFRWNTGPFT